MPERKAGTICVILTLILPVVLNGDDHWAGLRATMIREIEHDVRMTVEYTGKSRFDHRVMEVMATLPRHEFVPKSEQSRAYLNRPLPIGHGQTISQPYIVALMTDLLELGPEDTVLEIGTGSGYQAAVLGKLVSEVFTIEIVLPLATEAKVRLARLGFENVHVRHADGYHGWKDHAPFDAIIVTAASSRVPPPLIEQLKPGGRLVIPVGNRFSTQQLLFITKDDDGSIRTRQVLPVRFVPLTGEH